MSLVVEAPMIGYMQESSVREDGSGFEVIDWWTLTHASARRSLFVLFVVE